MHWTRFFGLLPFIVAGLIILFLVGLIFAAVWAVLYMFPWLIGVIAVVAFLTVMRNGRWA